ncbi:MAG: STT3 domain-containing protein [Candidatus Bathyarchaeota archaeon]
MTIICFIAFTVRILPLEWGAYLSEFDSFWHWYVADYIVKNGVSWIFSNSWIDDKTWFPWGRPVSSTTPIGLPLTAAAFYIFVQSLGFNVSLMDITIYFPPFMATLTVLALYFFGKEFGKEEVGLLTALFLALNSAYISRTSLGFFKHESIGVFAIVLCSLFFVKAANPNNTSKKCILYSTFSGIFLAYLTISWGAFYYMFGLIPLYLITAVLVRRESSRLTLAYLLTMIIGITISLPFPRPGWATVTTFGVIPVLSGFAVLTAHEALKRVNMQPLSRNLTIIFAIVISVAVVYFSGVVAPITGKFLAVVNPQIRSESPIIESVAEHQMSTWATFYNSFGALLFLLPLGLYFAFKRGDYKALYLILFGLTSLYFASSFIRLNLIFAPALCLIAAYGVSETLKSVVEKVKLRKVSAKKKVLATISLKVLILTIIIFTATLIPTFYRTVEYAYTPVTIASASVPIREYREDWFDALKWIDKNVPKGTPVICWWDYGYWVSIYGNSTSVADNATLNTTQIAHIGQILLSNETGALNLSKKYFNSTYILVFITTAKWSGFHQPLGFGDEGKWGWMARIANKVHPEISIENVDKDENGLPDWDTLLGKLILYACGINVIFEKFEVVYVSPSHQYVISNEPKITTQVIIVKGID